MNNHRVQPRFEVLEGRAAPAAGIRLSDSGVVTVEGDHRDNVCHVMIKTQGTASTADDKFWVQITFPGNFTHVLTRPVSMIKSILFNGMDGDDKFFNGTALSSWASGGNGNDHLTGGTSVDILMGGSGNDTLVGRAGGDNLYGGSGKDILNGQGGNDRLDGGHDLIKDDVFGLLGADTFVFHRYLRFGLPATESEYHDHTPSHGDTKIFRDHF